jgi:hypothetical protein
MASMLFCATSESRDVDSALVRRRINTGLIRIAAVVATFAVAIAMVLAHANSAYAGEGCTTAPNGYVCTNVHNSGNFISSVDSVRGKTGATPWAAQICSSSAFVYYVPPGGPAYSFGYASRANCVFYRAYFTIGISKYIPWGSRVCSKFMESGVRQGGEPCVNI